MELTLEEAFDIILELISVSVVIVSLGVMANAPHIAEFLNRLNAYV